MDVRGSSGKREYPGVIYLFSWVTSDQIWSFFDGWCAARNVDHEALPWSTWLNLVYYFATHNSSSEDKKKFDDAMSEVVSGWYLAKSKPVLQQAMATPKPPPKPGQNRERRMPPKPAGWGDDKRATFDNKAAIKTLTAGGVSGKSRRK